jgi:7-cyano-7-deazaguanine synthase
MTATNGNRIRLLLLSGGIDSAALAAKLRPSHTLFVGYGQRPAEAEGRAARAVARQLELGHDQISVGIGHLGAGLLSGPDVPVGWPSPEWWPFRNQLLITCAAAWALKNLLPPNAITPTDPITILTGTVASDGIRHKDGTPEFYSALNEVLRTQEGNVSVCAPSIDVRTEDLVVESSISDSVLAWTHSCHTANLPCHNCPGCHKRAQVLSSLGRLA